MAGIDFPPSPRIVTPTPQDSTEQRMRWMLADMHHYWWQVTNCRDTHSVNRLTQDIRKEWLAQRKAAK